jgi:hypothetical protein
MVKEYFCNICNIKLKKKYNYDKHLQTNQHKAKELDDLLQIKIDYDNLKIDYNKLKKENDDNIKLIEKLTDSNNALRHEIDLHKDNVEFLKHICDRSTRITESVNELSVKHAESNKEIALAITDSQKASSKVATKSIDAMKFIMENYKDAPNIEDIPIILTESEMRALEINPVTGSTEIIKRIYVENVDPKQRPVWCMDAGRLKFTTKHKGEWVSDPYGKILRQVVMNAIVNQAHKRATNIFQGRNPKEITTRELKAQTKRIDKIKHINQEKTQEAIIRRVSGDLILDKESNNIR